MNVMDVNDSLSEASAEWGRQIDEWVDRNTADLMETIKDLIQIPTENKPPHGDEIAGQLYLQGLLKGLGAQVDLYDLSDVPGLTEHPAYLPGRDYSDRPNLVARFIGEHKEDNDEEISSIGFSSHIDTAERTPLPWYESEPFSGEVKDGRLYGRGSYDMKGGLMASIFAVKAIRELGIPLKGDVYIESVVDEEWGGSNGTLATVLRGYTPDVMIIPEPSHMVICPAHLGVRVYRLTIEGEAGMRFGGEELKSPIIAAHDVLGKFQQFAKKRQALPPTPGYEGADPPPVDLSSIHADGYGLPRTCYMDFFVHCYENETQQSLDAAVDEFVDTLRSDPELAGFSLTIQPQTRFVEPSSMPSDHKIVSVAERAMKQIGREAIVRGAPFACDGYIFNRHSPTPALVLGPAGARAHAADEYVEVQDIIDLVRLYARMIVDWVG